MTEAARAKVVYGVLEELLEPQPRTVSHVWSVAQPLYGAEYEQVCEERALAGYCGSPMCVRQLPRQPSGLRKKLYHSTFCSSECEAAVQQLTRGLGGIEAARQRYVLAEEHRQRRLRLNNGDTDMAEQDLLRDVLGPEGVRSGGLISHGPRPNAGDKSRKAAVRGGIMSEIVEERLPVKAIYEQPDDHVTHGQAVGMQIDASPANTAPQMITSASSPMKHIQSSLDSDTAPTVATNAGVVSKAEGPGNAKRVSFADADAFRDAEGRDGSQAAHAPDSSGPATSKMSQEDAVAQAFAAMEAATLMQKQQKQQHRRNSRKQSREQHRKQQARGQRTQQPPSLPSEGPVLVLDIEEPQGGEDPAELRQVFGKLKVQDAAELTHGSSPPAATQPTAADTAPEAHAESPTAEDYPSAFSDVVVERSPTRSAKTQQSAALHELPAGKRKPSRFLRSHVNATSAEPETSEAPVADGTPGRGDGKGQGPVKGFGMDVARLMRKRRQEEEDAKAEAVAKRVWDAESLPPGTSLASIKAAARSDRGRDVQRVSDQNDVVMERLPGHLGSAVVQQATALADMAQVTAEAGDEEAHDEAAAHKKHLPQGKGNSSSSSSSGSSSDDEDAMSDSRSDASEQGAYPGEDRFGAPMLDDSDEEGLMPLPFPELSPFGRLYTLLDGWVTRETIDFVEQGEALRQLPREGEEAQRATMFMRSVVGCMPHLIQELRISTASRAAIEATVRDMVSTLDFMDPIGSLNTQQWEVALMTILKVASFAAMPTLQSSFESRGGVSRLSAALTSRGFTEDHFACLVEVFCPDN